MIVKGIWTRQTYKGKQDLAIHYRGRSRIFTFQRVGKFVYRDIMRSEYENRKKNKERVTEVRERE